MQGDPWGLRPLPDRGLAREAGRTAAGRPGVVVTVCCDDGTQVSAYTSEAAKQFVELFDSGNYPELEVDS